MKKLIFALILALFVPLSPVRAISLWEAGRLDYPDGNAEIAAFVNGPRGTQLQVVLCSKNEAGKYRLSLLLPEFFAQSLMFEVGLDVGGEQSSAYAELAGNSLEFQLDDEFYLAMAHSPSLTLSFNPEDAAFLHLPPSLDLPLLGASKVLQQVASQCVFLSVHEDFKCRQGLLSALLWPQQGFNPDKLGDIDNLCSKQSGSGYAFNLSEACRISLDRFYEREGQGALTFLHQLFFAPDSPYQKYKTLWNDAVHELPAGPVSDLGTAGDEEWYIGLYALAGGRRVTEFPHSYYSILEAKSDPTTLIYDIDSRYEMEGLKYVSVLMRRLQPSYQLRRNLEQSLNAWADFYRQLTYLQPYILQAQALRPVIYRMMLLRIWQLAGRPQGLTLLPEHAFRQGSGGKTVTTDPLERKCAYFEGVRGDEFFFGSSDCIASIRNELSHGGLITEDYDRLIALWDDFARAWGSSIFYSDSADDAVGENLRANFALTMLTASRIYGFGDYFLLRECISARDGDICALEKERALISLEHELDNKVNAIAAVSRQDAQALSELHSKWLAYQEALADYTEKLEQRGRLSWWQAQLVQATSAVLQTSAVISAPYYREELPDVSLSENYEDDFEDAYLHSELTDLSKQALDEAAQREKERAARAEKEGQPVPQN